MTSRPTTLPKRIWIDLDNSPHVPFFAPIIKELDRCGYSVTVTARDAYQVRELAEFFGLKCIEIGRHYGKRKIFKVLGTCFRALQLLTVVWRQKPDLAIAHGSRSQTLASVLARIPSLTIFDYEFANPSALLRATWLMMPEVVAKSASSLSSDNVLTYPGIKEDVYAPSFIPDPGIISELQIGQSDVIVALRPPATEAHYHNRESDSLLDAVLDLVRDTPCVKAILLPRNARQAAELRATLPKLFDDGKAMIPKLALDGLNLIWHSDLVIGGGGTMNREAAALGVPVYSIFRGKIGAVDQHLADTGRLVLLESIEDVRTKVRFVKRVRPAAPVRGQSYALQAIVDQIVSLIETGRHSTGAAAAKTHSLKTERVTDHEVQSSK